MPQKLRFPISASLIYAIFWVLWAVLAFQEAVVAATVEPTAALAAPLATPTWMRQILVPSMAASATQADYGAEVYRLVCSACHGDRGQGLTAEWLSTWHPKDQNCWQSKCHAENHPSDGFYLSHYASPLIGENTPRRFRSAQDLYDYISETMPWQEPGVLQKDEVWQITAFLLRENRLDALATPLDAPRAANLLLHPNAPGEPAEAAGQSREDRRIWLWWGLGGVSALAALGGAAVIFWLRRRCRKRADSEISAQLLLTKRAL